MIICSSLAIGNKKTDRFISEAYKINIKNRKLIEKEISRLNSIEPDTYKLCFPLQAKHNLTKVFNPLQY